MPSSTPPHSRPPIADSWRLLVTPAADGAMNMAIDEALMAHAARAGEWIFRVYTWSRPTLSLGRNQRAAGLYDSAAIARAGLDVVRRPTGGRALLHDAEVTYSVTAPLPAAGSLRQAYGRINRILLEGLRRLGVDARVADTAAGARSLSPGLAPCFDVPAPGELVAAGRKLVGSAQWRDERAMLQHGSILLEGDQSLVAALLRDSMPAPPPPATLHALLGRMPSVDEVAGALFGAVRELEDEGAELLTGLPPGCDPGPYCDVHHNAAWIWRR